MKEKRPYAEVLPVAEHIVEVLRPHCHRIEIAGSLRRKRETVGDIEIVAVPRLATDLFGNPRPCLEMPIEYELAQHAVNFTKNGWKYKQCSWVVEPGVERCQLDLFLCPDPATWGIVYLLRTGSAEFSHRMVTARPHGYMPGDMRVKDGRLWRLHGFRRAGAPVGGLTPTTARRCAPHGMAAGDNGRERRQKESRDSE